MCSFQIRAYITVAQEHILCRWMLSLIILRKKDVNKLIKTNFEIAKAKVKKNAINSEHITIKALFMKKAYIDKVTVA